MANNEKMLDIHLNQYPAKSTNWQVVTSKIIQNQSAHPQSDQSFDFLPQDGLYPGHAS